MSFYDMHSEGPDSAKTRTGLGRSSGRSAPGPTAVWGPLMLMCVYAVLCRWVGSLMTQHIAQLV